MNLVVLKVIKILRLATKDELEDIHNKYTIHFLEERLLRYKEYKPLLTNEYAINLICDTGHKKGYEIHRINKNAICEIYNLKSKKLITIKALRPGQIYHYYNSISRVPPKYLINKAIVNVNENLNNI